MTTSIAQKQAAKENIKKAQKVWQEMSSRQRSLAQPEGRQRKKPGSAGEGEYYHVVVRPKEQFSSFRTQDVGRSGHTQRVAGHRKSGSWATQKWLISKEDAHVAGNGRLVADNEKTEKVFDQLRGPILHVKGDIFKAKPRKNVPEKDKPTAS